MEERRIGGVKRKEEERRGKIGGGREWGKRGGIKEG